MRVHGTSRSNGESSSSGIVSRGGRSSAIDSIEEKGGQGEEEEEDYGGLERMNMYVEEEELSDHKMVSLYTLRRNPKWSRKLNDEEYSIDLSSKNNSACVECGNEFFSSKTLFSHMRCHPERE